MARFEGEALLLRTVDFGESDRIVHLLTPGHGRLAAIAKGARRSVKRFPGTLDVCNHLRVEVNPRRHGLDLLERALLLSPHTALRSDPARFGLACCLLELLDRLSPEGPGPDAERLFGFARDALAALSTALPDARLRVLLELKTLDALGLRPELTRCVRCGREVSTATVAFHLAEGGLRCDDCGSRPEAVVRIGLGTARTLDQALRFELATLERLALRARSLSEATTLIHRFQRFHLGVELRSAQFLDEVLHAPPPPRSP